MGKETKNINSLLSECSKLAQNEYKYMQDCVGKRILWDVSCLGELELAEKLYEDEHDSVTMNDNYEKLWNSSKTTDCTMEA